MIDEWGVFEGNVTIEDILEEIVGDIRDEFDTVTQEPTIQQRDDDTYVVDGGVPVQEVNEQLETASRARRSKRSVDSFLVSLAECPRWTIASSRTGTSSASLLSTTPGSTGS